jgi:hypothetical protein
MNIRHTFCLLAALMLGGVLSVGGRAEDEQAQKDATAPEQGVDVQARGPVHEAYATPSETRPSPSPVVTKKPPDPIEEEPPDQKPQGDNVQWLPGYWAWDADRNDFTWVSGFWRDLPPGREWVPGHWQEIEGGYQRVAGFWTVPAKKGDQDEAEQELNYLPAPPPTIERGASTPAPTVTSVYVPGCWVYRTTRYLWRPGFWVGYRPGWVWVPAHYVWTPSGYLFVDGYWDYPLAERGLLFAPVVIERRLWRRRGWLFRPRFVIQPDFLLGALFIRSVDSRYYFGDYFENRYVKLGFVPWISWRLNRTLYDPNYTYYRQAYATVPSWDRGLRALYAGRLRGDVPRPPRTLVQQNTVINTITVNRTVNTVVNKNVNITNIQNVSVLAPVTRMKTVRVTNLVSLARLTNAQMQRLRVKPAAIRLQAVPRAERTRIRKEATQIHRAATQRRQAEAKILTGGKVPVKHTDKPQPVRIKLPPRAAPKRPVGPRGQPYVPRKVPPPPKLPQHQAKPIPKHQPPKQSQPPKRKPAPPPKKGVTPPPKKGPPPPPPKKGTPPLRKTPPPAKKGPPPPPPKKGTPPPTRDKKDRKDKRS